MANIQKSGRLGRVGVVAGVAAAALALGGCTTAQEPVAGDELGGTLTIYGWSGTWDTWFEDWSAAFKDETGVDVVYVSGSGLDMYSRLVGEAGAPQADLLLSSSSYLSQADNQGLLAPIDYASIPAAESVDERFRHDGWTAFNYDIYQIAYNSAELTPEQAPSSWQDLADPKWAGKEIQRDPGSDLTAWLWMAVADEYDEATAWSVIDGMFANSNVWAASVGDLIQALTLGEGLVSPAAMGHVMAAATDAGATVSAAVPETPILMQNGLGKVAGGPNPVAADAFIDFFLDTYVQDYMMNEVGTGFAVNQTVELTNDDLVKIGLGGVAVEDVLARAYSPDWTYWTSPSDENPDITRLAALMTEISERVKAGS